MEDLKSKIKTTVKRVVETSAPFKFKSPNLQSQLENLIMEGRVCKDSKISEDAKNQGNHRYLKTKHNFEIHFEILSLYNKSIAYAPPGSEQLATSYGNRSALLRHIRKYVECICEVDKALKITKSSLLRVKLFCRKADCYTALGSSENMNCLEKARFFFSKSDEESEETRELMSDLIRKTQLIVDANKLDKPKENRKRIEATRLAADAEKKNVWESVKMEFSKKHGKYLVAARDFEPGEIILVERPYFKRMHESKIYCYCHNCFEYLWTVVPCQQCAWRLYCSGKCKDEAWNKYHDIECPVLVKMKEEFSLDGHDWLPPALGIFCKALKEAGSIEQLQSELKKIDECKDECRKGFSPDGKFEGFRSIYAQPLLRKVDKSDFEQYALSSSVGLIGLAKHSNIFGKKYEKNEMKQLTKDDAAIFVGALILKFHLVIHNRVTMIHLYNAIGPLTREDPRTSSAIKSLGFLNILSCAPNAKNCVTYDDRHLMYALHPIKKGTPLTTSMTSCIYQNYSESKRQLYNRTCKCEACTQNWLSIIDNESLNEIGQGSKPQVVSRLDYEMDKIEEELKAKAWKLNHPDVKLLSTSSKIVAESWKHFPMPSLITYNAITLMMSVYDTFYLSLILDPEKASLCVN